MEQKKIIMKREDLYEQVWSKPMTTLAKEYNISDVGLAKICKKLNIPKPEPGYWAKVAAGKSVVKNELPTLKEGEVGYYELKPEDNSRIDLPESILKLIEEERKDENKIIVPQKYVRYHEIITNIRKENEVNPTKKHSANSAIRATFDIRVQNPTFDRALRIFDTLMKELEKRGYTIITKKVDREKNTYVVINGVELKIILSEKLNRILSKDYGTKNFWSNKYEFIPSGILKLEIDESFHQYETDIRSVRDTITLKLEDRLNEFVIALLKGSEAKKKSEEYFEKERIKRQKEEEERRTLLNEIKAEKKKCEELWKSVNDYYRCYQIRLYIKAVEDNYRHQHGEIMNGSNIEQWLKWANDQADRIDPLKDSPPSVLDQVSRFSSWELG
jgi:hypothetical protein